MVHQRTTQPILIHYLYHYNHQTTRTALRAAHCYKRGISHPHTTAAGFSAASVAGPPLSALGLVQARQKTVAARWECCTPP